MESQTKGGSIYHALNRTRILIIAMALMQVSIPVMNLLDGEKRGIAGIRLGELPDHCVFCWRLFLPYFYLNRVFLNRVPRIDLQASNPQFLLTFQAPFELRHLFNH